MVESIDYQVSDTDIAIVGMAGRFPGARNIDELWRLIRDGVAARTWPSDEELLARGVPAGLLADPNYVRSSGPLEDVECFDAGFFDLGPRDAAIMDPQHRHFLECAWEALEHSGHVPESFAGAIGVYAGSGMNGYMLHNLMTNPELIDSAGMFLVRHTGNDKDFLATEVSYSFNLKGPSVNVQTACSTSLVAIHLAIQALLNGECDMALAGGVTIEVPHGHGYLYREGEILSPDGYCRAFDAKSGGTVFGSGAGVVVLRRLRDAIDDGDTIHAVIKGTAINNDGSGKVGYLAPSVDGHAAVVAEALAVADVPADSIQYFEAHGTGTRVGDPIEIAALTQAFRGSTNRLGFCRVGSTKPNIGHLDTAAGVASVIKVVEALKHRQLPPLAGFTAPNPIIDFDHSPFYVSGDPAEWPRNTGAPRRAGVSSLGVGGTNAHAILQEAPEPEPSGPARPWQLLTLSAKTQAALDRATADLAQYLTHNPDTNLADVACTLQTGRSRFAHRRVVAVRDARDAVAALESGDAKRVLTGQESEAQTSVVFMFPGAGSQYPNMGRELYDTEPVYREEVDRCLALLEPGLRQTVRSLMYPSVAERESAAATLEMPAVQAMAIFITEYALAKLWMSWGVQPAAMTGHSLGEYTAACLAGVISLKDALTIVEVRGRLIERTPDAAMLSVPLPEAEVRALMGDALSLASVNGPELCVVSGRTTAIAEFEAKLKAREVESRRLKVAGAFHSSLLDPFLDEFAARLAQVGFLAPSMPYVSNVTGTWVRPEDAQDPAYWVRHLRHTVRFSDGIAELLHDPNRILIEVGPGTTLSGLARQQPARPRASIASLPHPQEQVSGVQFLLTAVGRAWMAGATIDWRAFHGEGLRRRLPLPTYPFERQRYWIAPGKGTAAAGQGTLVKAPDMADWFYRPVWKRADLAAVPAKKGTMRWLVFMDDTGLGARLVRRLRKARQHVVMVFPGEAYGRRAVDVVTINPASRAEHEQLILELANEGSAPHHIVHLWSLTPRGANLPHIERAAAVQRDGFFSLLYLAQALAGQELAEPVRLTVVSAGMQRVDGEPADCPEAATVLGPVRVMPREIPNVTCQSVDVTLPARRQAPFSGRETARQMDTLAGSLQEELFAQARDVVVAMREGKRWVQDYDPAPLAEAAPNGMRLREGGVYLITGGLGGISLALAEHLARSYRAKLVLQGRTPLPDRDQWEAWLERHDAADLTSERIRKVTEIEALGGEVLLITGDVTSAADMRAVVANAVARFGALQGVFHAAGVLDDGVIQLKTAAAAEAVLAPKVAGTLVLDEALRGTALDFMVLFSSTSAIMGLEGQADYTGANAFLNAFAASRQGAAGPYVVAVDWGVWREVGVAARMLSGGPARAVGQQPLVHPLLGAVGARPGGGVVYNHVFDVRAMFALDEHRVHGGNALLPGAGYLEMARAAAERLGQSGTLELREVFFIAPLEVLDSHPRAVRVTLTREGAAWQFSVSSNPAGAGASAGWHDHAAAELRYLPLPAPARLDLAAIEARCREAVVEFGAGEQDTKQERHLQFGPRWKNVRRMGFGTGEALARLELREEFRADLEVYKLHPALLDLATSFALPLVAGYEASDNFYVPMSYGRARIYAPFPARVASYARLRDEPDEHSEVVSFDVTITDEDGAVLAEVEEFSLRRVDGGRSLMQGGQAAAAPASLEAGSAPEHGGDAARRGLPPAFHAGILPAEGMEALGRILAAGRLPEVVVSPVELRALLREAVAAGHAAEQASVKISRPEVAGEFLGPRDEVERFLATAWQDLLGIERVGIRDDFFDLGGHSLIAARLLTRVKKEHGVQLALATLFEAPTIEQFATVLRAELGISADLASTDGGEESAQPAVSVSAWSSLVTIQKGGPNKQPVFFVHGKSGNVLNFRDLAVRVGRDQPVYGLQAVGLNGVDAPHTSIEDMAAHYLGEIRRVQPQGPYMLGGFSGGGTIAFEMAHQLRASGEEVSLLAFLDTWCPDWFLKNSKKDQARWFLKGLLAEKHRFLIHWLKVRMGKGDPEGFSPVMESAEDFQTVDVAEYFEQAERCYRLRPLDAPVAMFRAMVRAERGYVPRDIGWGPFITRGITVYDVPGGHESMCLEPAVYVLAAHLRTAIAEATRRPELAAVGD